MARPTKKTPAELIAELETRLLNTRLKAAKSVAADNPQVSKIQSVLDSYTKEITDYSRKLVGPNSFENRLRGIVFRQAWIEAEQAEIVASDRLARSCKDYLQHSLADMSMRVSNGETIGDEFVDTVLANVPTDSNLPALMQATTEAHTAWKTFTDANKAKVSTPTVENTEGS